MPHQFWVFLHLLGVIVWVGGMFFAYFCLRPAAASVLLPAQRLPLWDAAFQPFLRWTAIAVAAVLVSGTTMMVQVGMRNAPLGWHLMMGLGLLMAFVFLYVYIYLYPKLRLACQASDWPAAGTALNRIRHMVEVNLGLSLLTLVSAILIR
jgi:uncharacterized membrane protein